MWQEIKDEKEKLRIWEVQAPEKFLIAWKKAVVIIGEDYFINIGNHAKILCVQDAIDKDQLRPSHKRFIRKMNYASTSEKIFMGAIYTFFNCNDGQIMINEYCSDSSSVSVGGISNRLDLKEKEIISELLLNHSGW